LATVGTLVCVLALAGGGGVAQAATSFGEIGEFGVAGMEDGQFSGSEQESPRGIAVGPDGDLWVVDGGNARVQKLEPTGSSANFLFTFGWGVQNGSEEFQICASSCQSGLLGEHGGEFGYFSFGGSYFASGIAVEPSPPHDVYVTDTFNGRVEKFGPSGVALSLFNGHETPEEHLKYPWAVTVDSSGHVYVMDSEHEVIDRFSSTGIYECQITGKTPGSATECNGETAGSDTPQEGFSFYSEPNGSGADLAVDSSGNLYVLDTNHEVIDEFGPSGGYLKQFAVGEGGRAVAVDSSGDVFAARAFGTAIAEFDPAVSLTTPTAELGSGTIGRATGIVTTGNGASERLYVTDRQQQKIWIFGPVVTPTCATVTPPNSLTATSAMISGTINPEGVKVIYDFEYGTSESYGSRTDEVSSWAGDEATEPKEVGESLTGLEPHQTYDYQLVASSIHGSSPCGNQTLTTESAKPSIEGEGVDGSTQTEATLLATVNPNNEATHFHFEYGTSPSLSGASSGPSEELVAAYGNIAADQEVSGLQPNTTYYYRVLVSNTGGGTSDGPINSFLTRPANPATGMASDISQTEATVTGTFNPGGQDTGYFYEYGACELPKTCAESTYPLKSADERAGSGVSPVEPTVKLSALTPLTTYHYRLVVNNLGGDGGGSSYGREGELTTLPLTPSLTTDPPVIVGNASATLAGTVVPEGAATTYRFEYGQNAAYGSSAPAPEGEVAATTEGQHVTASITDLQPETTYHYRLVAANSGGAGEGIDQVFTTNSAGEQSSARLPAGFSLTQTGTPLGNPSALSFPSLRSIGPVPPAATRKPLPSCEVKARRIKNGKKRKAALIKCGKPKRKKKRG
jgi:streptogramin lyase